MKKIFLILCLISVFCSTCFGLRIANGDTNRKIVFLAVDPTDNETPETGLTSFTVYYSFEGDSSTVMTTPTVSEPDTTNKPGEYWLSIDESGMVTMTAGIDEQELSVTISHASMQSVTRNLTVYRPKITAGQTVTAANGAIDADVERLQGSVQSTTDLKDFTDAGYDPSTNKIQGVVLVDTTTTNTDMRGTDNAALATGVNVIEFNGATIPVGNIESQYDGTGLTGDTYPATQSQLGNISISGSAENVFARDEPDGFVITIGSGEVNNEDSTHALDGTTHQISDTAGAMDVYYEFSVGGAGTPSGVTLTGYLNGGNDDLKVYGLSWPSTWIQIGELNGKVLSANEVYTYKMFVGMVGTGADIGKVRVRLFDDDYTLTSATLFVDQIFVSRSRSPSSVGYDDGSVWGDTVNGVAGTEVDTNGTADNPCLTWADATTLLSSVGVSRVRLVSGSSVELVAAFENKHIVAYGCTINLSGESINGSYFEGATIVGNDDGSNTIPPRFRNCKFTTNTLGQFRANGCPMTATLTLAEAGTYILENCLSAVAGTSAPIFDIGAAVGDVNLNFRHWSGGTDFRNFGQTGTDNVSIEGQGQVILNANCIGGTVAIRGDFTLTDNSSTTTISDDARFTRSETSDTIWDEVNTGTTHNVTNSTGKQLRETASNVIHSGTAQATGNTAIRINLSQDSSTVDGHYDPAVVNIVEGTGADQSRQIWEYDSDGTNRYAYINRAWKTIPDGTSEFTITANSGDTHVNEGLARGGTSTTIILNTLASTDDDVYNNQIVFIAAGPGEDEKQFVQDYDGLSQTVTIYGTWVNTPTTGTVYAMLPEGTLLTGDSFARLGSPEGASISADIALLPLIAEFFSSNSGETYSSSVAGSVVKEIADNASAVGGDATEANQNDMIDKISGLMSSAYTLISAVGSFDPSTDSTQAIRDRGDVAWISGASGSGAIVVDHNTGGADNLAYKTAGSIGIDNASVYAYLKTDYDGGNYGSAYIKASTTTDVNGQWVSQMNLDAETYTFYFFKQGFYGPDTVEQAVN